MSGRCFDPIKCHQERGLEQSELPTRTPVLLRPAGGAGRRYHSLANPAPSTNPCPLEQLEQLRFTPPSHRYMTGYKVVSDQARTLVSEKLRAQFLKLAITILRITRQERDSGIAANHCRSSLSRYLSYCVCCRFSKASLACLPST